MSEEVRYSATVRSESAFQRLGSSLRRRGVVFRNPAAWEAARRHVESLMEEDRLGLMATGPMSCGRELSAALDRLQQDPVLGQVAASIFGQELSALSRAITDLGAQSAAKANPLVHSTSLVDLQRRMKTMDDRCRNLLQEAQADVLLASAADGLKALGYATVQRGKSLRAIQGRTCVWVQAEGNRLHLDLSGFSGLTCIEAVERIERELRRQGLVLDRTGGRPHLREEGGELARNLRRRFHPQAPAAQSGARPTGRTAPVRPHAIGKETA